MNSAWAKPAVLADAVALVGRVRTAAAAGAREGLEVLAAQVSLPIAAIAIRELPELPATTEERIADSHAASMADSAMYREALGAATEARGWSVHWYEREKVVRDAAEALGGDDLDTFLRAMGERQDRRGKRSRSSRRQRRSAPRRPLNLSNLSARSRANGTTADSERYVASRSPLQAE